jgi:hypothetical protein
MAVKMRAGMTKLQLFGPWLVISAIWVGVVGYRTWHDTPRDDWLIEPSTSQLSDAINLILYNPVARAVVVDSIMLALIPPILVLALIWSVREFQRQRQ